MKKCKICEGIGYVDVLDIWSIQREHIKHGAVSIDSAKALPMLKKAIRCPKCHGNDATDSDTEALTKRMGGCPWEAETFE